jgi:hypothetical protein
MGASIFFTAAMIRVNYDVKQLAGKKFLSCFFHLYRFHKYMSYGFPIINSVIPEYIMKRPVKYVAAYL